MDRPLSFPLLDVSSQLLADPNGHAVEGSRAPQQGEGKLGDFLWILPGEQALAHELRSASLTSLPRNPCEHRQIGCRECAKY
jgi:hypothetical protein